MKYFITTIRLQHASLPAAFGGQSLEKGLSLYDRTHKLSLTWLYELPFMRTQKGVIGKIVGGWATGRNNDLRVRSSL